MYYVTLCCLLVKSKIDKPFLSFFNSLNNYIFLFYIWITRDACSHFSCCEIQPSCCLFHFSSSTPHSELDSLLFLFLFLSLLSLLFLLQSWLLQLDSTSSSRHEVAKYLLEVSIHVFFGIGFWFLEYGTLTARVIGWACWLLQIRQHHPPGCYLASSVLMLSSPLNRRPYSVPYPAGGFLRAHSLSST